MNWYKNQTVYEFVLYNLYNNCMNLFIWIRTKISEKNCIQDGISTRDQYWLAIAALSAIHHPTSSVSGHFHLYIPYNSENHPKNEIVQIHSCGILYSQPLATCNMHAVCILQCNIDPFLLNQNGLESTSILPKFFCKMHIAHHNMRLGIESIFPLTHTTCVGPQIGMNPIPLLGLSDLEYWQIPIQTDLGSPCSNMGIAFLVYFFQSCTRLAPRPPASRERTLTIHLQ